VHGFLKEIGQGIQHVASRVEDLVDFVQRGNDYREIAGEGFTFLNIPRSYYGVLSGKDLKDTGISMECADALMLACFESGVTTVDGAVDLSLSPEDMATKLEASIPADHLGAFQANQGAILDAVSKSIYKNLHSLLKEHVSVATYMGIVKNQILVDVQGEDLLYQIFTANILQRNMGEEAPFFEFIQRVCSECCDENGCPLKVKPGCGGFG
jgi:4-hydroxyphenylpyruvate dioxygenase-like putative hemolysin